MLEQDARKGTMKTDVNVITARYFVLDECIVHCRYVGFSLWVSSFSAFKYSGLELLNFMNFYI